MEDHHVLRLSFGSSPVFVGPLSVTRVVRLDAGDGLDDLLGPSLSSDAPSRGRVVRRTNTAVGSRNLNLD